MLYATIVTFSEVNVAETLPIQRMSSEKAEAGRRRRSLAEVKAK